MASTSVKVFSSTDPGAQVLSGTAGSLATIIRTCLADGRGAQAVQTLVVASGIATVTYATNHPFSVGSVGLFAGATPTALNGEQRILSVTSANIVTFAAPGVPDGSATGSMTSKLASAGWTELYPGTTNVVAVKPSVIEATGCCVRIDDTGTTVARVRGFESMSSISAGLGLIPLDAQISGGAFWDKSNVASAAARPWFLIADARGFHMIVDPQANGRMSCYYGGDCASTRSANPWGFLLTGNPAARSTVATVPEGCNGYSGRTARVGAYLARSYTGIGGSLVVQRIGQASNGPATDAYSGGANYSVLGAGPNSPNNGLMLTSVELISQGQQGTIPGIYHARSEWIDAFSNGVVVDGTDDMLGRQLLAIRCAPPTGAIVAGTVFFDATGPWGH